MAGWSRSRKSCVPCHSSRRCPVPDIKPRRQDRPTPQQGLCARRVHVKSLVAADGRWQSQQYAWRFLLIAFPQARSEEHTSELQSHLNLVCRLLLEKKKKED